MDFKAPASSGSSNVGPVSSSNAYYSATIPANARVKLIARLKPYIFHIRTKPRVSYNVVLLQTASGVAFSGAPFFRMKTSLL